jgi:WD40 repeat protein
LVWDVKKCEMVRISLAKVLSFSIAKLLGIFQTSMWHDTGHKAEVTCVIRSPQLNCFAVGYADGSIRLWDSSTGSVISLFNGHKRAVTALAFDKFGAKLASGSQDTDLIVWDIVAEAGLFRYVQWKTTIIIILSAA